MPLFSQQTNALVLLLKVLTRLGPSMTLLQTFDRDCTGVVGGCEGRRVFGGCEGRRVFGGCEGRRVVGGCEGEEGMTTDKGWKEDGKKVIDEGKGKTTRKAIGMRSKRLD
ncbi:hypothetical protein Pmani_030493 [Petrolisthes manimaculis]|uniref:Uncharacterized protein n=1 Tax=Petrolisthes manimaculis TaxID=1843537 RepID=A0AAE1TSU1_9EUCA|nr:hypothetical protein Pmani_030493 [Petrolisthes manimaculis]